ncbi:hypothetical protein [Nocardia africana]|uniref:hypothetical protein n=1 Tax=Nocardia africana TaxID=134964 RepID=UPI0007A46E07|nr:hypothetical protein [Nocardia africana]MCC3311489.1 hypothetical protein [Nocardia africana]
MRSFEEYDATARDERPFSNSTEWEIWYFSVCCGGGNPERAYVDDAEAERDPAAGCPLIALSALGRRPTEWVGGHGRYRCREKTLPADARRAEREAEQAAVEAQHYGPLFDIEGGS